MLGWFALLVLFVSPLLPIVLARAWLRRQSEVVKVSTALVGVLACFATLPLSWWWMELTERRALDGYAERLGARVLESYMLDPVSRRRGTVTSLLRGPRFTVDLLWPDGRRSQHTVIIGGRWLGWLSWRADLQ